MPVSFQKEVLLLSKGTGTILSRPIAYAEVILMEISEESQKK